MANPLSPAERKKQQRQQERRQAHNARVSESGSEPSSGQQEQESSQERNTELSSAGDRAKGYASKAKDAAKRRTEQAKEKAASGLSWLADKCRSGVAGAREATQGRSASADINRTSEKVAESTAEISSMTVGAIQRTTTTTVGVMKGFVEGIVSSTGQARLAAKKFSIDHAIEVARWDGHIDTGDGDVPNDSCVLEPHDETPAQRLDLNHAAEESLRLGNDPVDCIVVPLIDEETKRMNGCYVLVKGGGPVYHQPLNAGGDA
jgi:hypothetical protein